MDGRAVADFSPQLEGKPSARAAGVVPASFRWTHLVLWEDREPRLDPHFFVVVNDDAALTTPLTLMMLPEDLVDATG